MICPGGKTGIYCGFGSIRIGGRIDKTVICGQRHIALCAFNIPDAHIPVCLGEEDIPVSSCRNTGIHGIAAYRFRTGLNGKRSIRRADTAGFTGKLYTGCLYRSAGRRAVHNIPVRGNRCQTESIAALSLYNTEAAPVGIEGNVAVCRHKLDRSGIIGCQRRMQHINIRGCPDIRLVSQNPSVAADDASIL